MKKVLFGNLLSSSRLAIETCTIVGFDIVMNVMMVARTDARSLAQMPLSMR